MTRALVALDLTGVLENSWPVKRAWLIEHAQQDFGEHPVSRHGILKGLADRRDLYKRLIAHSYSDEQIARHVPIDGAVESLEFLSRIGLRFAILTSRADQRRNATEAWLRAHGFARFVESLVMLGFPGTVDDHPPGSKLRWCIEHNAVALVDDSVRNLAGEYREDGEDILRFLFDTQEVDSAWDNVINARDWSELRCHLGKLA